MKRLWLLAAVALFNAAPADTLDDAKTAVDMRRYAHAETLLRDWLATHEDDQDARFLLARVYAWQSRFAPALDEYDRLLRAAPQNTDYLFGKAQVLVWDRRPAAALPLLEQARRLNPQYADVWRLNIQALHEAGGAARRWEALALQAEAKKLFPHAAWTQSASGAPDARRLEIEAGAAYDNLDQGFQDWRGEYVEGALKLGGRKQAYAALRRTERFDLRDEQAQAGLYFPLAERWTALIEAAFSPTHRVLPQWSLLGQVGYNFDNGWNIHLGVRHTEYSASHSTGQSLTLERYWGDYRATYTFARSEVQPGGSPSSHGLQLHYYYNERSNVGLRYTAGQEEESLGVGNVLTTDVRAWGLSGRHWFTPDWAFTYDFGVTDQGDRYTRTGLQLGLRHRF